MWAQGMDLHLYSLALIDCLSDNHAFSPFSGTLPRLAPMPCHSPCNGFSPGFSSLCTHLLGLQTLVFISGGGRTGWCCAMLHHPAQPGLCWLLFHLTPPCGAMEKPLQGTPMPGIVLQDHRVELRVHPAIFDSPLQDSLCFPEKKPNLQGFVCLHHYQVTWIFFSAYHWNVWYPTLFTHLEKSNTVHTFGKQGYT